MSEVLLIVGLAIAAFFSTNLDNLFLLMGLLVGSELRTRDIALGYAAAMLVVLSVGLASSYVADLFNPGWLRYLGLIPLTLGLWRLRAMFSPVSQETEQVATVGGTAAAFGLMLANSGDSLAVFTPLMAETSEVLVVVIFATALALSSLWVAAASWVVEHPALAPRLHGVDRYVVPLLLLAIGVYILTDSATDTM